MAFCSIRAEGLKRDYFGEVPGLLPECEDLSHSPRSLVDFTSFHQQEAVVPSGFFFLLGVSGGGVWEGSKAQPAKRQCRVVLAEARARPRAVF